MINHWLIRVLVFMVAILAPVTLAVAIESTQEVLGNVQALTYGVGCIAVVAIERMRRGSSTLASGLVPTPRTPLLGLLGALYAVAALAVILLIALALGGSLEWTPTVSLTISGLSSIVLFALGEEIVFRGTIFEALRERFGPSVAIIATSVPFALAHLGNPGATLVSMCNVALAGILLGIMVHVTSSLWMAIAFHVTWNVLLGMVFGAVSGLDLGLGITRLNTTGVDGSLRPWITGPFGVEEGYATTLLLIIITYVVVQRAVYDPYVRAARFRRSFSS